MMGRKMNGYVAIGLFVFITLVSAVVARQPDRPISEPELQAVNSTETGVQTQRVPVRCRLERGKWKCARRDGSSRERNRDRRRRKFSYRILDAMNTTDPVCMPGLEGPKCDKACFNCTSFERLVKRINDIETKLVYDGQQQCQCPAGPRGIQGPQGYPGRDGRQGPAGPRGPPGPMGKRGPPGPVSERVSRDRRLFGDDAEVLALQGLPEPTDLPKIDLSMFRGPEGARGPRGYPGPPGDAGPAGGLGPPGPPGGQGPTGPQGRPGPQGPFGPPGPKGIMGDEGVAGPPGPAGQRGEPGFPGPAGIAGPAGRQGEPGMPGEVGQQGDIGPKGDKGDSGAPGQGGQRGRRGFRGPRGVMGRQGLPGTPGETGQPGDPGRSGMPGTPGRPGLPGEPGPQGPAGLPGRPGSVRYHVGAKGDIPIRSLDDEVLTDINDLMDRLAGMPEFQRLHRNIEGINREYIAAMNDLKIKLLSLESRVTFLEDKLTKMEASPREQDYTDEYSVAGPDDETTDQPEAARYRRRFRA